MQGCRKGLESANHIVSGEAERCIRRRHTWCEWLGAEESGTSLQKVQSLKAAKEKQAPMETSTHFLSVSTPCTHLRSTHQSCHQSLTPFYSKKESNTLVEQTMSHSTNPQGWEQFKNSIRALYIAEAHPLEGPNGVIKLMESRHGFRAT
jgi:hypothetical protein